MSWYSEHVLVSVRRPALAALHGTVVEIGFEVEQVVRFVLQGPKILTMMWCGRAGRA